MERLVMGQELGVAICNLLNIDPTEVTALDICCRIGEPAVVKVSHMVHAVGESTAQFYCIPMEAK